MTATVKVYGASDDLIEVEGDIREEFTPRSDDEWTFLAFNDGTVLRVTYDGIWRIWRVFAGTAVCEHLPATAEEGNRADGTPAYSDIVTLTGAFSWCVFGTRFA